MKRALLLITASVFYLHTSSSHISLADSKRMEAVSLLLKQIREQIEEEEREERRMLEWERFLAHLAFSESAGNPDTVNTLGYIGKYQFGRAALSDIGFDVDFDEFRTNPSGAFPENVQDLAIEAWFERNERLLRNEIERYSGTIVNGIPVTKAGILAASHLGGVGGVKRFFRTGGAFNPSDAYGTSISKYMKKFSGFDI